MRGVSQLNNLIKSYLEFHLNSIYLERKGGLRRVRLLQIYFFESLTVPHWLTIVSFTTYRLARCRHLT
ncbi:hypothetical protein HanRHA438_Chr16g0767521 [Helianthus annuus]|nr:hypothetical protein HanRHA438_Chr16g0767521 [Helianthus annuus]